MMNITYVLQNNDWAWCSVVKNDENLIDISGEIYEGSVDH
jgi:hypothetical protein